MGLTPCSSGHLALQLRGGQTGGPYLDISVLGEPQHRLAIGPDRRQDCGLALGTGEPKIPAGDLDTGGQALDVPLDGTGKSLVEVVEPEHQRTLGGVEHAEVQQMGIAAELSAQPAGRSRAQIRGHHRRTTPEESKGRGRHPPVSDGNEVLGPLGCLALEDRHGVRTLRRWDPLCMPLVWQVLPHPPPASHPLTDRDLGQVVGIWQFANRKPDNHQSSSGFG